VKTARGINLSVYDRATYVCIEGPRYSTRAESRFFKDYAKADIIGMTLVPECVLAREAEICYLSIASVTDYDVWAEKPVSTKEVIETLGKNVENTRKLLAELILKIPLTRHKCDCGKALEGAKL
ncbi:MAG: S-methyl-5'-thioadenosine phosphorylase, partial [Nitrososphaerales archaeon]